MPLIAMMNQCAPSTHSAAQTKSSWQLLCWVLGGEPNNVGLFRMPVYALKTNKVAFAEQVMMTKLTRCTFNADRQYTILFKDRADARDHRPLTYPGRLLFPGTFPPQENMWWNAGLRDEGYCGPIPQMKSADMLFLEDMDDESLPKGDENSLVRGGYKYQQMGPEASKSELQALFKNTGYTNIDALMAVALPANHHQFDHHDCVLEGGWSHTRGGMGSCAPPSSWPSLLGICQSVCLDTTHGCCWSTYMHVCGLS